VELEPDLEGLLHISELADHKVDKPQDVVNPAEEVEVKILNVDTEARKIGLSLRRVQWAAEGQAKDAEKPAPGEHTGPYKDTFRIVLPSTVSEEPAPEPESQPQDQAKEAKKPTPVEHSGPYKDTFQIKLPRTASEEPAPEPESQAHDPTPPDPTKETPEQDENG
jgi:predicted RNA-binding protein with RPS1 domain